MKTTVFRTSRQQGVASLTVVMVLFFIVSLVAAYASRNLIFEQRTATNQYRSTQAFEAAQAGLEWALTMLNGGRIDASCQPVSLPSTQTTFRDRYLSINANGVISALKGPTTNAYLYPTCVQDGTGWSCSCPSDGPPSVSVPTSAGIHPAFRVYLRAVPGGIPGQVQIWVNGCTVLADSCLQFTPASSGIQSTAVGASNEGIALVVGIAGLTGGIASPPVNALTARGNIDLGGAAMSAGIAVADPVFSTGRPPPSPYVVHAGGTVNQSGMNLSSLGGTPAGNMVLAGDPALSAGSFDADRMFAATFNMSKATFANQQGLVTLDCAVVTCNAQAVRDAAALYPSSPILVLGDLAIDSAGDIGSTGTPVLLVVTGDIDFGASAVNLYGVVYVQAADWTSAGAAHVIGATIAEGNIGGSTTATFTYNSDVVRRLRAYNGSFALVPGSWQDFQP